MTAPAVLKSRAYIFAVIQVRGEKIFSKSKVILLVNFQLQVFQVR